MSDGVEISGWKPVTQSDLSIQNQNESKKRLRTWWQRQKRYSYQSFSSNFQAAKPRQHVYNTLSLIRQSLSNLTVESWLQVRYEIIQILTLRDNQNRYEQICSRMIRGNLYRYLIAINRQLIILSQKGTSSQQAFLSAIKVALSKRIDSFQREIFQLIDFIESRNH